MDDLTFFVEQAAAPDTAPERLSELWRQYPQSAEVGQALAANPNTPIDLLLRLAAKFPREFVSNSVLPLLYLEDLRLVEKIPTEACLSLFFVKELPGWIRHEVDSRLEKLNCHCEIAFAQGLCAVHHETQNPEDDDLLWQAVTEISGTLQYRGYGSSIEIFSALEHRLIEEPWLQPLLKRALYSADFSWRRAAATNAQFVRDDYDLLRRAGSNLDLTSFAKPDESLAPEELIALAERGPWAKRVVARHPNTPADLLDVLVRSHGLYADIAANPAASATNLETASVAKGTNVLTAIARHPNVAPGTLARLYWDERRGVRMAIARSPKLMAETVEKLANASDSYVRSALARNPALAPEILEKLAADENSVVRLHVARHPKTPLTALQKLANDDDGEVLDALWRRADLPDALLDSVLQRSETATQWGISRPEIYAARVSNAAPSVLEKLASRSDSKIRRRVAKHRRTMPAVLATLAHDGEAFVRIAVAGNPRTPPEVLWRLVKDENAVVCQAVIINPAAPLELLVDIAENSTDKLLLSRVAGNPSLPPEILAAMPQRAKELLSAEERARVTNWPTAWPTWSYEATLKAVEHNPSTSREQREEIKQIKRAQTLQTLATSQGIFARAIALAHPETPYDVLQANRRTEKWQWRYSLAINPAVQSDWLEELARDGHLLVREAAQKALDAEKSAANDTRSLSWPQRAAQQLKSGRDLLRNSLSKPR